MPKSKHRRKGKTRPRGLSHPHHVPPPEEQAMEAAQKERFRAFLAQTGRTEDQLSHADFHEIFDSQEWAAWKGQHPLPDDAVA